MKQGYMRLRSVWYKDGRGELRVMPDHRANDKALVERRIRALLDSHHAHADTAGFAIVVWGADGSSTCDLGAGKRSNIPTILVPDFVRNRLLAAKIIDWAMDDICGPSKPDGAA